MHRHLGPGLLEGTYRTCLVQQLTGEGLEVEAEVGIPVTYKGRPTGTLYRADMIVCRTVLLELKAVDVLLPVHSAQMLSYLRITGLPLGLLINFNVPKLITGVRRFAHTRPTATSPFRAGFALTPAT